MDMRKGEMTSNRSVSTIPYAKPYFPTTTAELLLEVFKRGQVSGSGSSLEKFESEIGALLGSKKVLGVSNGSAALRLAFQALNLQPGRRVVLPSWGFHVAANVAFSMGAQIEFRDVDEDSWCLELDTLQDLINLDEEIVIVLIHTLGNSTSVRVADKFRAKNSIKIIEDSAEAFLSKVNEFQLGTIFDIGTYSMHAAKTITTGEGGFVSINDKQLIEKCTLLRNHGMDPNNPYVHLFPGDNFRISNLLAALAIPQLEIIDKICAERMRVYRRYQEFLCDLATVSFLAETDPQGFFPWGVCARFKGVNNGFIAGLRAYLLGLGVDTRPSFTSAENLPYYSKTVNARVGSLGNANLLAKESLLLPQYVELSDEEIGFICKSIKDFLTLNS